MGIIVLVGVLNPWSFIPAVFGIIVMLMTLYRFARCFRDLKRLEGVTRSPIYSYLVSTLHGLKVIRSYHAEEMCSKQFLLHLNDNIRAYFLSFTTERWEAVRFDTITVGFLGLVTILSVFARIYYQRFSAADIALTLSYCLNLVGLIQWAIRSELQREKMNCFISSFCF